MRETFHKWGDGKNKDRETLEENYCSTVKNQPSRTANLSKNLLLGHTFNPELCVFSSSDRLKTSINR